MMSKASFMMQDHLRRNYVMITDVSRPTTFFVRGRLPFPQGLMAIAALFKNKRPADVYAHPYFIEKQSDPSQPSPQLHLTEESQGIMKVISGLRYMRDDNTKLDNTTVFVTDYKVPVTGRMPLVPAAVLETLGVAPTESESGKDAHSDAEKKTERLTLEQRALLRRTVHHVQQVPGGGGDSGIGSGGMRRPALSATGSAASAASAGAGDRTVLPGYSTFPTPEECAEDASTAYRFLRLALYGRRAVEGEKKEEGQRDDGAAHPHHSSSPVPPPQDVATLFESRTGGYTVLYNPIEMNEQTFVELLVKLHIEERVVKAIVVPTRPAWRHLQAWADFFPDAELICSGEVPLVRAAGFGAVHVPHIADAAAPSGSPTGTTRLGKGEQMRVGGRSALSSSQPPHEMPAATDAGREWRGGCQDLGGGLTGLSFPEVDLEAERLAEEQRAEAAAAQARATAEAARLEQMQRREQQQHQQQQPLQSTPHQHAAAAAKETERPCNGTTAAAAYPASEKRKGNADDTADPYAEQRRRQEEKIQLRREMAEEDARARAASATAAAAAAVTTTATSPLAGNGRPSSRLAAAASSPRAAEQVEEDEETDPDTDLVDVLWQDASFFAQKAPQPVGLRESDAPRLRILSPRRQHNTQSPGPVDQLSLTPTIELLRIRGDAATEEYVLYDHNSHALACTDLFHGSYADLDPANSWMCRVWFKFMKRGDYKRTDMAPRYKWLQVLRQGSLPTLQRAVEELTRTRPIRLLIYAHGTPPLQESAVSELRQQWSLPPLHPMELPRDPRGRQ